MPQLQSRFLATLVIAGKTVQFTQFAGGELGGASGSWRPPGAEYMRKGGGEKELAQITLTVPYDPTLHTDALISHLYAHAHEEDAATVSHKPRDKQGRPVVKGLTYTGVLVGVTPPASNTGEGSSYSDLVCLIDPSGVA